MTTDTSTLAGLTDADIARHFICPVCRKPILGIGTGVTFYRVRIEHCVVDARALDRRAALSTLTGSPEIASVLTPDLHLAKVFDGPIEILVHEVCAMDSAVIPIALTDARKAPR